MQDLLANPVDILPETADFLRSLPRSIELAEDGVLIHDNPLLLFSNEYKSYIYRSEQAVCVLAGSPYRLNFVGHTHMPVVFSENGEQLDPTAGKIFLEKNKKYILNPGAIMGIKSRFGIYDAEDYSFEVIGI
jgi:hypothetical protein